MICLELNNNPDFLLTLVLYWHSSIASNEIILVSNTIRRALVYIINSIAAWIDVLHGHARQHELPALSSSWMSSCAPQACLPRAPRHSAPGCHIGFSRTNCTLRKVHITIWGSEKWHFHAALCTFCYTIIHSTRGRLNLAKTMWFCWLSALLFEEPPGCLSECWLSGFYFSPYTSFLLILQRFELFSYYFLKTLDWFYLVIAQEKCNNLIPGAHSAMHGGEKRVQTATGMQKAL